MGPVNILYFLSQKYFYFLVVVNTELYKCRSLSVIKKNAKIAVSRPQSLQMKNGQHFVSFNFSIKKIKIFKKDFLKSKFSTTKKRLLINCSCFIVKSKVKQFWKAESPIILTRH